MTLVPIESGRLRDVLQQRLQSPPRCVDRRFRFVPQLGYGRHRGPAPHSARPASVVVLLYQNDDRWFVPFTLRPETLSAHAGQVSLPGGAVELEECAEECGLRELHEEIGVPPGHVSLLGRLSPVYVYRSQFVVQPLVAIARQKLTFQPDAAEVSQLLEIPVGALLEPSCFGSMSIARGPLRYETPCFRFDRHLIWGATLKVVGEFLDLAHDLFRG